MKRVDDVEPQFIQNGVEKIKCNTNQEDVCAELQDAIHTGQLLKHDGVRYLAEEATHKLPDDEDHRHIQTHDPEGKREEESRIKNQLYEGQVGNF